MPWRSDLTESAAVLDLLAISACSDNLVEIGARSRVGTDPGAYSSGTSTSLDR